MAKIKSEFSKSFIVYKQLSGKLMVCSAVLANSWIPSGEKRELVTIGSTANRLSDVHLMNSETEKQIKKQFRKIKNAENKIQKILKENFAKMEPLKREHFEPKTESA